MLQMIRDSLYEIIKNQEERQRKNDDISDGVSDGVNDGVNILRIRLYFAQRNHLRF